MHLLDSSIWDVDNQLFLKKKKKLALCGASSPGRIIPSVANKMTIKEHNVIWHIFLFVSFEPLSLLHTLANSVEERGFQMSIIL